MRGQFPRHRLDPLDDAAFEIRAPEFGFHVGADFRPARKPDPGVDAAIGDDLDLAIGQQEIDQHAVVVRGVPYPQLRKNIQRSFPRQLVAEQRPAIQRALHHEADLAGMRRLTCLDRLLDRGQHCGAKNAPSLPVMFYEMPADALDAHAYQLPDAPPPPKLPPPPLKEPLSLELPLPEYEPPP